MVRTIAGLVGQELATDKRAWPLPIAMMMVAAAATMIPASLLMQRWGRSGFWGTVLGSAAGLLAAISSCCTTSNCCVGEHAGGGLSGLCPVLPFAAADIASRAFKTAPFPGWLPAALLPHWPVPIWRAPHRVSGRPRLLRRTWHSLPSSVLATLVVSRIALAPPGAAPMHGPTRTLLEIMRQPVFLTALVGSSGGLCRHGDGHDRNAIGHAQMCGQSLGSSTHRNSSGVTAGHVHPLVLHGNLIHRHGVLRIMGVGITLLAGHVAIALSGNEFLHFLSG